MLRAQSTQSVARTQASGSGTVRIFVLSHHCTLPPLHQHHTQHYCTQHHTQPLLHSAPYSAITTLSHYCTQHHAQPLLHSAITALSHYCTQPLLHSATTALCHHCISTILSTTALSTGVLTVVARRSGLARWESVRHTSECRASFESCSFHWCLARLS